MNEILGLIFESAYFRGLIMGILWYNLHLNLFLIFPPSFPLFSRLPDPLHSDSQSTSAVDYSQTILSTTMDNR